MSKKNLPNIPIYIGDWERDCNVLSLESEMAWMKIIFKMHLSGKQSTYKSSTKALQILWKSSPEKVQEILDELICNDICVITKVEGGFEFVSRRLKRESELSEIRTKSVSKRYKKEEKETYKPSTKHLQNTDIDIDYENDNEIKKEKGGMGEKTKKTISKEKEPEVILPFDSEKFKVQWNLWKIFRAKEHNFKYKSAIGEQGAINDLVKLSGGDEETALKIIIQSISKGWKGFFELKNNQDGTGKQSSNQSKVQYSEDFQRKIIESLQS